MASEREPERGAHDAVFVVAFSLLVTIALLAWVLGRCRYGIDLTDESFYLAWMRDPSRYRASVLLFGFLYHPLYELCGGNVALLRRLNVLLTVALAGLAFFALLRGPAPEGRILTPLALRLALSTVLAASALLLFAVWLPTPSYNGLALHALALATTGMVLAEKEATRSSLAGWTLMGLSGWLAYMAKPTTAAALAVVVVAYLLAARKVNVRLLGLAAAVAVAAVTASAFAIDGSIAAHVSRLEHGAEMLRLLDAGHMLSNLIRVEGAALEWREALLLAGGTIVVFLATALAASNTSVARASALVFSALLALVALAPIFGWWTPALAPASDEGLQLLAAPVGLLLASLWLRRADPASLFSRPGVALSICLAALPFVHAFGSSANYWTGASKAAFFWLLAAAAIVRHCPALPWRTLVPASSWALAVTMVVLAMAMEHPARQPQALRLDRWPTELGPSGHPLLLSEEVGVYLSQLRQAAKSGGFEAGDPVIDLTGHAPGALFALRARALGQPWIIGGYRGSAAFAQAALDTEPCEDLARAWILVEDRGPRSLPVDILSRYGIDARHDAVSVGPVWSATGEYQGRYVQRLLKPRRDPAVAAATCLKNRLGR